MTNYVLTQAEALEAGVPAEHVETVIANFNYYVDVQFNGAELVFDKHRELVAKAEADAELFAEIDKTYKASSLWAMISGVKLGGDWQENFASNVLAGLDLTNAATCAYSSLLMLRDKVYEAEAEVEAV